ncbi:protein TILLER ANGLE CONTROL 1 [Andrographis paniculata]|uniref:protein TILLER ANGLE CONTROL 1 n=1 Tax=Andrographis paniculata TaxID=175694 RepID=UPI0021E8FF9A|nr:protein TILLER ANGLE CONTROL 1 [Andrographis paniculata]
MKIFNWVHRRFYHKDSGLAQNGKKCEEDEKQFLLQVQEKKGLPSNVFDEWKGGILAIGTFGYDRLKVDHHSDDDDEEYRHDVMSLISYEEEEEEEEQVVQQQAAMSECEEDANPLMYAAYAHNYAGLLEMKRGPCSCRKEEEEEEEAQFEYAAMMKMKRERTTLAELFSADSDEEEGDADDDHDDDDDQRRVQKNLKAAGMQQVKSKKNHSIGNSTSNGNGGGLSFAKKIIGEDHARPAMHKLNRLMRRMLKRKIHPSTDVAAAAHQPHKQPPLLLDLTN